ncbi:MAG: cell division protein FtsQ/DivIB [Caulobacteraceae bacterium]
MSLSPRLILALGAAVVVLAVAVVLGTNHRGERLAAAVGRAALDETAKLGFSVQSVRLAGASPQSADDILAAAAVAKGAPIFGVDLDAVRQRVEAVGWVKSARVMRLLPDSVLVSVDERKLVAVW